MDQIGSPNPRFSFGDLVKKVQGETEQTGKKGLKSIVKVILHLKQKKKKLFIFFSVGIVLFER